MIYLIAIVACLGVFEVRSMMKSNLKKEAVVWIVFAIITLAFGIYYLSNPFGESLSAILLGLFGMKY